MAAVEGTAEKDCSTHFHGTYPLSTASLYESKACGSWPYVGIYVKYCLTIS